ncbi:oligosaccharide flippase family protein [Bifidobacterium pullorum]|uniref:oligosaccharide flippase family protein n=1 Tax=Bifidobacterium pullorum TaxID=78448 RepID=UPI003365038C
MFFVSGYVLHYFLGNTMSAASYGVVGTVLTVLDFEYMFVSNGARQSLAGQISRGRYDIVDVIAKTTLFQCVVIACFFAVNFWGAPLFAIVFDDASLDFYFRIAGLLVIVNGLQVIVLGINDGLQRFGTSALLSTVYPIAKLGVIPLIIFVFSDDPVLGVEIGFILAVVITIVLGCILLAINSDPLRCHKSERIPFTEVARHTLGFSFFFVMVSLVLSVDTLIVKAVVRPADMAGYYTGAMNFGKIAYYLLQAFSTVILPVVAQLVASGKKGEALSRIRELLTLAFAFILPMPIVISASSSDLLCAFYSEDFVVAAPALTCLALSNFFMGMTVIANMVLNSAKTSHFSDILSIVSLAVVVPLFVASARFGGITAIAVASVICTGITMVVSFIRVYQRMGNVITRGAWGVIGINAALWIAVHVGFPCVQITNLFILAVLYVVIYALYIVVVLACRIVPIPKLGELKRA